MRSDTPSTILERVEARLTELEAHVAQLDLLQQLMLRLLSIMHPLSNVLAQYGATSSQERELLQFLDQLTERVHSLDRTRRPTFEEFEQRMADILPALRNDVDFLRLVVDTLRVERVAYRELHDYMTGQGWPARIAPRT
jgi:hypothetical protein